MNRVNFLDLSFYGYEHLMVSKSTPYPHPLAPWGSNPPKNEHNLNFLRNHLTNRDDFLNLSFYGYKLTSSLEVTPLRPTTSPPGLKKTLKMNLTLIFSETI